MLDEMLDIAKARLTRIGRPREAEEAERLVAERAPGEAPARWVSGRDDDEYLLWVATEGRVLLLEQAARPLSRIQANSRLRAASEMATTAGCRRRRSIVMA